MQVQTHHIHYPDEPEGEWTVECCGLSHAEYALTELLEKIKVYFSDRRPVSD